MKFLFILWVVLTTGTAQAQTAKEPTIIDANQE